MTEDAPTLYPSATELWQYAQAITTISGLSARLRVRLAGVREQDGRLAFSEAENAARHHEARQCPAVRLMTDDERAEWQRRVPASLAAQRHGEPLAVWTALLAGTPGAASGERGVEAHAWKPDGATTSLFAVCRDAEDALAVSRYLREHGTAAHLDRMRRLADGASHQRPAAAPVDGPLAGGTRTDPAVLSEPEWEAALRRELPAALADKIIVTDPVHPHHVAWRELYELANEEVRRTGTDPARLAALVRTGPNWNRDVRNPPALAHWAITQARGHTRHTTASPPGQLRRSPVGSAAPLRVTDVTSPEQAAAWAAALRRDNPEDRLEAKLGFGRWGPAVDRVLAATFPGIVETTARAARKGRRSPVLIEERPEPATIAELAAEVNRLDPTKPIDRRAAHVMLGRVPAGIDRLLAEKFGDDPQFAAKLRALYPDGVPDATAAAWRAPASGDELAVATPATRDDPRRAPRQDGHGRAATTPHLGLAAQHHGIAATLTGHRPPTAQPPQRQPGRPALRA